MLTAAKEFLITMGQFEPCEDNLISIQRMLIDRDNFHSEELSGKGELLESILNQDRIGTADGLADVAYVVAGTAVLLGLTENQTEDDRREDIMNMTLPEALAWLSTWVNVLTISQNPYVTVCDILTVLERIAELQGVDLNTAFRIVHENNMSKATNSLEDAQASMNHYGFPITLTEVETASGTRYVLRSDTDDNPKYFRGKVLKPLSWSEPDMKPALKVH